MRHFERLPRRLKRWVAPGLRLLGATRASVTKVTAGTPSAGQRPDRFSNTVHELVQLAWPIAAAMLGETMLGLVDTKLVGGLGAAALGGVGVGTTLMYLCYSMAFGLARGVKVRTAYAQGRGSPGEGVRYAQAGILLGVLLGIAVWALGRDLGWALAGIGIDKELILPARDFIRAVTWGSPATCALTALVNYKQGLGDSRSPMAVGLAGNVFNVTLSYGLIYGHFGLPALGVRGAGFGTAATEWVEVFAMLALLARDARRAGARPSLGLKRAIGEVAELGVPTGLQFGAELLAFSTFTAILGGLGSAQIAAHQIAMVTIRTSFLPGIAVGEAASVLVGRALAQRRLSEADRVTGAALLVAVGFMAACGVVFAAFGHGIARAFTSDVKVASVAALLLLVAAGFQILDAINIVLRGALRGAKDVRVAALIGIGVVWTCVPTAAFVLGRLAGWGAVGGWCGFVAETLLSSVLFARRWRRGAWRNDYARGDNPRAPSGSLVAA